MQTMYADAMVGRFLDGLRESGIYDEALVVVMADHGVSFEPGGLIRTPTAENLDEMAWVPLFVKEPGQRTGEVSDVDATVLDVLPTIADVVDVEIPWPVDGRSLLDHDRPPTQDRRVHVREEGDATTLAIPPAGFADLLAAIEPPPSADLLASGGWTSPLPWRDLVGQAVDDLDVGAPAGGTVTVDAADAFAEIDLDGPLPGYVTGTVQIEEGEGTTGGAPLDVALAVDGRIAATATLVPRDDGAVFAAMLPERYFRAGENALDVYIIERATTGVGVTLRPLH
jgi:hypothetical protein